MKWKIVITVVLLGAFATAFVRPIIKEHIQQKRLQRVKDSLEHTIRADAAIDGSTMPSQSQYHRLDALSQQACVPLFISLLHDSNAAVRWRAASMLVESGEMGRSAIPDLIAALNDAYEDVRTQSVGALAAIDLENKEASLAIARHIADPSIQVRSTVEQKVVNFRYVPLAEMKLWALSQDDYEKISKALEQRRIRDERLMPTSQTSKGLAVNEPSYVAGRDLYQNPDRFTGKPVYVNAVISQAHPLDQGPAKGRWTFKTEDPDGSSSMDFFIVDERNEMLVTFLQSSVTEDRQNVQLVALVDKFVKDGSAVCFASVSQIRGIPRGWDSPPTWTIQ